MALASAEIKATTTNQVDQNTVKLNKFLEIVNHSSSHGIWSLFEGITNCSFDNFYTHHRHNLANQFSRIIDIPTDQISTHFWLCNYNEEAKLAYLSFKQEFDGSKDYYTIIKLEPDTTESIYQEIARMIGTIDSEDTFYFVKNDNDSTNYYIVQIDSSNDYYDVFIGIRFQHQSTFSGYKTLISTSNKRHLQFLQDNFLNRLGKQLNFTILSILLFSACYKLNPLKIVFIGHNVKNNFYNCC